MYDQAVAEALLKVFRGNPRYVAHAADGRTFAPFELKKGPLPPEKLKGHFEGRYSLGFYLLEGNQCYVSCADFDNHNGENESAIMDARTVMGFLIDQGFQPIMEISQSGQGAHVWIVNPHPMEAATLRLFWKGVLSQCQVKTKEIYPRQDSAGDLEKGLGNLVRYPLYGQSHFEDLEGNVLDPLTALSVEPASAYDIRTKGELWYDVQYVQSLRNRYETDGLPSRVADLINEEEALARRWAGDLGGLSDQSRSSLLVSIALELVRRYVPTPEIKAAIQFWCESRDYRKSEDWIERTIIRAYDFAKGHNPQNKASKNGTVAAAAHKYVDRLAEGLDPLIPSSIPAIDKSIGGAAFGEVIVVACRPSNGKSAITLQWLHSAAILGYAACLISLEMSPSEIASRIACNLGFTEETPVEEAHAAIDKFYRRAAPLYLVHDAYRISAIEQTIRYHYSLGCRVFAIDHMGKTEADQGDDERTGYAKAYSAFSKLAKQLNIIIIACQQRNRKADDEKSDDNPRLSSLHGSGAIEQDADVVVVGRHLWKEMPNDTNLERYVCHHLKCRNRKINHPVLECKYSTDAQLFTERL